jgi:hypothetical protein
VQESDGEESDRESDPPFSLEEEYTPPSDLEEEDTPSDAFSGLPFMPPPSGCPFFRQYNERTLNRLAQTFKQALSECADMREKHHAHGLLRLLGQGEEMDTEYIKSLICCFPLALWVAAQKSDFNMRTLRAFMLMESVLSESQCVDHGKVYFKFLTGEAGAIAEIIDSMLEDYDGARGKKPFSRGTMLMLEQLSERLALHAPDELVTVHYVGKTIQEGRKRFNQKYPKPLHELSASLGVKISEEFYGITPGLLSQGVLLADRQCHGLEVRSS